MSPPDFGLTFLAEDEADRMSKEEVEVTLRVTGYSRVAIGKFLDLIEDGARRGGLECDITAPGYRLVFYGWEKGP